MIARPLVVRSEAGVTLVELLVAISILGVIVLPLTNAMATGFRSTEKTEKVLVASADRQMLTTYLPPDALSATAATTNGATTACLTPDGTRVVLLTWSEYALVGGLASVIYYASDYRLVPAGGGSRLVRDRCEVGSPADELTVAHDAVAAVPTIAGAKVAITVTDSLGAQYTVSGTRRAA